MMQTITHSNEERNVSSDAPVPERLAEVGDVYEFVRPVYTVGRHQYLPGDRMEILKRTNFAPFGYRSSLGNLLIKGRYGKSVWSCFEACIAEGSVRLVSCTRSDPR